MHKYTLIIPLFNEEFNISNLINEIYHSESIDKIGEIICVNDFSSDNTLNILKDLSIKFTKIVIENHKKNFGQSACLVTAANKSIYPNLISIDGDGQNNPKDIIKLIEIYENNENTKLVGGLRKKRKDPIIKIISSKFANFIRQQVLKDNCSDTGCSLKVFEKKIFLSLPYFSGLHRFLPAFYSGYNHKTEFIVVDHRKRQKGQSKYGTFSRLISGLKDMIYVYKFLKKINE